MKKIIITFILTIAVLSWAGFAQAQTFVVDPDYSSVMFRIQHLMGYAVGLFQKFDGKIVVEEGTLSLKEMEITIGVGSLNTQNSRRDEDLRSDRFFEVEKYPQATFKTKKVEGDTITGDLTLHGVTKEVSLSYRFWGVGKDQYGRMKAALSLNGVINRRDFGITFDEKTDDGKWLLGDAVEVMIEVQGVEEK